MPTDSEACPFEVLSTRSSGLSPLLQQKKPVDVGGPLKDEEGEDIAAFDRPAYKDEVLRYTT